MKRKIIGSLLLLFLFFASGAVLSTLYIRTTTAELERLIQLHQIEHMRQDLIVSIQAVQSELYTVGTSLGSKVDIITDSVSNLEERAAACRRCHHTPAITEKLDRLQTLVADYENALSFYITAAANSRNIERLKMDAAAVGNNLLHDTEQMSIDASRKLSVMTAEALRKIAVVKTILGVTTLLSFFLGVLIAYRLTISVTRPVSALVNATRTIAEGNLDYEVPAGDRTEFGQLAAHFNRMTASLREGYAKLQEEIAERRQTEAALVKSEAFLNTIFDSIRDPFCIIDRDFRIVRVNEAYAAMKGRMAGDLAGRVCYEELHGRDSVCDACIVQATFRTGHTCAKEKMESDAEGHTLWYEVYTYPILEHHDVISHVIEYTRNISERKRTEMALRESEQRYALAAMGANDGLWDWDVTAGRIYYSIRWKSMLGYDERDIGDAPDAWFSLLHEDDRDRVLSRIRAYEAQGGKQFEVEYRIRHKDGTYHWMLCRGMAVRDGAGRAKRMAGSQTDITARKAAEEQLLHDALHDALTGLPNRALFLDRLQHALNSARRLKDYQYAVLFFDVDRFKVINDSLGHAVGDMLLIEIGRRIAASIRPGDTVARLGGDEFAVLLENMTGSADAVAAAERIQKELEPSFLIAGNEIYVTQSIGIAPKLDRYEQPDQVLVDADIAMYAAKAKGKARYEMFSDGMHSSIVERLQMESELRVAVEHLKEFVLYYQPILDVNTQQLAGFEALVRWQHPKRGLVAPMDFIPLAEETGLIHALGEWILRECCGQLRAWQELYQTSEPLKMSVNVSGKQFLKTDFYDIVVSIVQAAGIDPGLLAIEITESIIMEDLDAAVRTMNRLREFGIQIHIDDFGTGYSSLSYLHRFPVTALKIDRSFISRISLNDENREVVRAIVTLAQNLNLHVIAEGVELSGQLQEINAMACHFAQGFYFSRPMPVDDLDILMERREWVTRKG